MMDKVVHLEELALLGQREVEGEQVEVLGLLGQKEVQAWVC